MSEDYLWDRSGEPDDGIVHLEAVLEQLRGQPAGIRVAHSRRRAWLPVAAAIALAGFALVFATLSERGVSPWQISVAGRQPASLRQGEIVDTGNASVALHADTIGDVRVESKSKLRLVASGRAAQLFSLDRGTIHATIWAPPTTFIVDTPSAKTVDLGCQYTLHVADDGAGLLTVEMGWVAFQRGAVESFIPGGAACRTNREKGPGTPYFLGAPERLKSAIQIFDATADPAALETILGCAREQDGLTLWHLLERTSGADRARVADRFAALEHLGAADSRALKDGKPQAMDSAWEALHFGNALWLRDWKRNW